MNRLIIAAAVVTTACAQPLATSQQAWTPADGNSFVVRNVRAFDGTGVHEGVDVVVRDGRIVSIGKRARVDLPVIDGAGRTLLPGLIDAHAHVNGERSLRDALRFGVTTELDMLSRIDVVRKLKPQRDSIKQTELADVYTAGSPITSPRGLTTQFGIPFSTISAPSEAAAIVKSRLAEGSDFIKVIYEPGAPLFTSISRETLEAVIQAAHAEGVQVAVHISSLQGARDAVRAGADGLAHIFSDSVIDEAFAQEIAARKVFVSATLTIIGGFQRTSDGAALAADTRIAPYLSEAQKKELLQVGPGPEHPMAPYLARFQLERAKENVRRMKAAGVRILAGTDAPNLSTHGVAVHGELKHLVDAGLTPLQALTAATREPADAFRMPDRGRIAAGARADLVLVEGNPVTDITAMRAIVYVFKNGYIVARTPPAATPPVK
jgi:imidazolonepropionase-like amidohydrolase